MLILVLFVGLAEANAQSCLCPDGITSSPSCCPPGEPVPISGFEWLLGAGAVLGVKRLIDNSKKKI